MKLDGSEWLVLKTLLHLQGDTSDYVDDARLATATKMSVKDVWDWLETLEGKGLVERSRGIEGFSAYVNARGKQEVRLREPIPITKTAGGGAPVTAATPGGTGAAPPQPAATQKTAEPPPLFRSSTSMADPNSPSVFISYSHDSEEHADHVLALADALCDGGIAVNLDRYVHPAPAEGWPLWMEYNLDAAKFVLMICTETYLRRVMGQEEPGKGTGVRWEGKLIYNRICYDTPAGARFIPILLPGSRPEHIPGPVRGHNHYVLATFDLTDPGFEALYRHLTGQAPTPPPDLGKITTLPPTRRRGSSPDPR